jgi:hypothetical protein
MIDPVSAFAMASAAYNAVKKGIEMGQEIDGFLAALGELPTKTNAMFLIQKIQAQAQPQVPPTDNDTQTDSV